MIKHVGRYLTDKICCCSYLRQKIDYKTNKFLILKQQKNMIQPKEFSFKSIVCFSHLRWDFVYQRPQHLLSRFAAHAPVYFIEEPIFHDMDQDFLKFDKKETNLHVIQPHIRVGLPAAELQQSLTLLIDDFLTSIDLDSCLFWYYTPMALTFTAKYTPKSVIYDCMDELSAFKFAPSELVDLERKLMAKADLVFTGGHSLYDAKKDQHDNIFAFPSSIEKEHFFKARNKNIEAADQQTISGLKIGFFGVIDERFNLGLIHDIAVQRPEWQIILIGPVVKIDPASLPQGANIHYLGQRSYAELPSYLAGWSVALIPFLLNESTKFISPTKTPEYLAAGVPVVSTPIKDVVRPYGIEKLVHIAANSEDFIKAIDLELNSKSNAQWLIKVDLFLKEMSWDHTCAMMSAKLMDTIDENKISIAS